MQRKTFSIAIAGLLAGLAFNVSAALALDAQQEAVHRQATSALKSATADLDAARSSAGTASNPAKGSRLRLTQMRLDQAKARLEQASATLAKLPADDAQVVETKKAYDEALAAHAAIDAIIHPKESPATPEAPEAPAAEKPAASSDKPSASSDKSSDKAADKPAAKPAEQAQAKPAASPRLHYQQEDQLGNARFNLRDAQSRLKPAQAVVSQMDDPEKKVVHSQVVNALKALDSAQEKLGHANKTLASLPAEHDKVAPVISDAKETANLIGGLKSRLDAAEKELGKLAKIENYPNYNKDLELLGDLAGRYRDFQQTVQQPEVLAQTIAEDGNALKEVQRIARTYLPLVEQKTPEGERMENTFNHFQSRRSSFAQALMEYKKQLPALFQQHLDEAASLARQGVEQKKPAFFGPESGIEQQLGFAQDKLTVIQAFGPETAAPFETKLKQTRDAIAQAGKALESQIINSNTMPRDNFQGEGRDAIIAIAKDGWSHQQKDAKVLKAVIVSQAWKRDTRWTWHNGSFSKSDLSRVQVQLVIQHDDKLAVIQPVNVHKNHLSGDTLTGHPMRSGDETPPPQAFLLLEKVN